MLQDDRISGLEGDRGPVRRRREGRTDREGNRRVPPRSIYAELKRGHDGDKLDKNFRLAYDADLAQKRAQESLRRRGRKKGGPAK